MNWKIAYHTWQTNMTKVGTDYTVKIVNVQKSYGKKEVLKDINFSFNSGSCIGILGGNGNGKTTLLSILMGIQKPSNGYFYYNEKDLFKDITLRRKLLGLIPQNNPLIEELTAFDNLLLWYNRIDLKKELSNGTLSLLGIDEFISMPVYKMSGGMKKRLSIACALATNPQIILMDEPTSALDFECQNIIHNYIKNFKASGKSVILVTHDALELDLCDSLYILKNGVFNKYNYNNDILGLINKL